MDQNYINYPNLIDEAMHIIVKKSLQTVIEHGIRGEHHFYISFLTQHPGVELSRKLQNKYPEEMTIVLQHQFEELIVADNFFSVKLSFDGAKEKIVIPFNALTAFADPGAKFGVQFRGAEDNGAFDDDVASIMTQDNQLSEKNYETKQKIKESGADNIVTLDSFRKKK